MGNNQYERNIGKSFFFSQWDEMDTHKHWLNGDDEKKKKAKKMVTEVIMTTLMFQRCFLAVERIEVRKKRERLSYVMGE